MSSTVCDSQCLHDNGHLRHLKYARLKAVQPEFRITIKSLAYLLASSNLSTQGDNYLALSLERYAVAKTSDFILDQRLFILSVSHRYPVIK